MISFHLFFLFSLETNWIEQYVMIFTDQEYFIVAGFPSFSCSDTFAESSRQAKTYC